MNGWERVHIPYSYDEVDGIVQVVRPGTGCISYIVHDNEEAIVVDPSIYIEEYLYVAEAHGAEIIGAIDTHAHADHISGAPALRDELNVPYYLHSADSGELDQYSSISHYDTVEVGTRELEITHTPGHTPGSIIRQYDTALLTGDTLFIRSVGRPDLEGSDEVEARSAAKDLFTSLQPLANRPDDVFVFPGHYNNGTSRPAATSLGILIEENELFGTIDQSTFVETIVDSLSDKPANYNLIKAINWGEELFEEEAVTLELGPNNCAAN